MGGAMDGSRQNRAGTGVAVSSRNFPDYLADAASRSERNREKPTIFRAETRWVSARRALMIEDTVPIYFAEIGKDARVTYTARLSKVIVDVRRGDPEAQRLLQDELERTKSEELWEAALRRGRVKTLYAIIDCKPVLPSFPINRLIKASDGVALSANFRYSYALVEPLAMRS